MRRWSEREGSKELALLILLSARSKNVDLLLDQLTRLRSEKTEVEVWHSIHAVDLFGSTTCLHHQRTSSLLPCTPPLIPLNGLYMASPSTLTWSTLSPDREWF